MTRKAAIQLLAAMAAIYIGPHEVRAQKLERVEDQDNPPVDAIRMADDTGNIGWFTYSKEFALSLDETTKIHVHKGGELVTITAEEIWDALHEPQAARWYGIDGTLTPAQLDVQSTSPNSPNIIGNGNKVEVGP